MDILPENTPQKQCTGKCKRFLPATTAFFYKSRSGKHGVASACIVCAKEKQTKYRLEHTEQVRDGQIRYDMERKEEKATYNRQYQMEHRDEIKETHRRYQQEHKEEIRERSKQYRLEHIEESNAHHNRYWKEHKEELSIRSRQYRIEHIEELRAYQKRYQQSDQVRIQRKANSHRRRAYKRGAGGTYTARQLQDQLKRQKHKCYWCSCKLGNGKGAWHADHAVPLSRGGSNDISNIVIACPTCNIRRNNKLPHEWPEGGRLL